VDYVPPELTELGKKLLGLLPYDASDGAASVARVQAAPYVGDTESDDDKQAGPPLKKQCGSGLSKEDACTLSD
jgi:hypothetical protein